MKVIFLDFDGVITIPKSKWHISVPHVKRIKKICDVTDAKIVISSSWQRYAGTDKETEEEKVKNWLNGILMKGYKGFIRKFFAEYTFDMSGRFYGEYGSDRGSDIKSWLVRHPEVDSYVIIDDEDDMMDEQLFNFVQTDFVFGIQDREVELAIQVLNKEKPYSVFGLNDLIRFKRWLTFPCAKENNYEEIMNKYYPYNKNKD
jgi:hypothetical protein